MNTSENKSLVGFNPHDDPSLDVVRGLCVFMTQTAMSAGVLTCVKHTYTGLGDG